MKIRIGIPVAIAASLALIISVPDRAEPASGSATLFQAYEGTGWKIANSNGVRYLGSSSWTIVFYDSASRTALTDDAKRTAYELKRQTGVTFYVTTTINKGSTTCPTGRVIIMRLTSTVTRSSASQCHTATGAADGSRATFALTNWQNTKLSDSNAIYRRKVVSHELGHSVGLTHPSTWTTPAPLMRGEIWGGYKSLTYAAQYTPQDINGLNNLRANASKLPPPAALTTTVNGAQVHEPRQ